MATQQGGQATGNLTLWTPTTAYVSPLRPSLRFDPVTGFVDLANHLEQYAHSHNSANANNPTAILVNPKIATYTNNSQRQGWINSAQGTQFEAHYAAGVTVGSAASGWPAGRRVVGLVCSSLSSAAQMSAGQNNWHVVGVAREGRNVWVQDSEYLSTPGSYPPAPNRTLPRVADVNGTIRLRQLQKDHMPTVRTIDFQGPPVGYVQGRQECMGRAMDWVEAVAEGRVAWPPGSDGSTWQEHSIN